MPNTFYKPMPRSPYTELDGPIDAYQTTIPVVNGAALPDGPNVATIGIGASSETIQYDVKNGDVLEGVTRGYSPAGSASAWDNLTPIARVLSPQDIEALQNRVEQAEDDIEQLDTDLSGDISTLDGRTTTVEGRLNTYDSTTIPAIEGDISSAQGDITTLQGDVSDLDTNKADKAITLSAGNGLTGGGDLSNDLGVALGTPSTINVSTTNSTTSTSHTHNLDITKGDIGLNNVTNDTQLPIAGGTMTGVLTAQNNTSYTTRQVRNITLSTGNPTGGSNGDIWIKYSA